MKRIFGAKKQAPPPPSLAETYSSMEARENQVEEKIRKLESELMKLKQQMKATRPGVNQTSIRQRALQLLKQKKMYEAQRDQLGQQRFNIDQARFASENMKETVGFVQGMSAANAEMRRQMKVNKELNPDYVDNLQDDFFDMMDRNNEVQASLSRCYDVPEGVDEDEMLGELEGLEYDMIGERAQEGSIPSYLQDPDLPAAPASSDQQLEDESALQALRS